MLAQPYCSRRRFLKQTAAAAGAAGAGLYPALVRAAELGGGHPLAPRPGHFPARAQSLIFVFLTGGYSHVDTFDYKPALSRDSGKVVPAESLRDRHQFPLLGSPFTFKPCGQSGLYISELFPCLHAVADQLCVIRTLHTDILEHFQSTLAMHTGSATVPLPSIGSWLSYGLGTRNPNLPSFVVLAEHTPYAGAQVWDNNFLPPFHQGVRLLPGERPIADIDCPVADITLRELEQRMLRDLNEQYAAARPDDLELAARVNTFDVAQGMMRVAPEVFDLSQESASTLTAYGCPPGDNRSFAWQCLVARRLVERGVRVVELIDTGSHDNWDAHGDMQQHRGKAARVDRPLAALITDLKQRGLLQETLIAICTEFGRTPWSDNGAGRNHWHKAFSCLLCGGGVKGGIAYGSTDEYGIQIAERPCHVHDYHATILYLMGLDHTRHTYRYAGRDWRLTDVAGRVLHEIVA